MAHQQESFLPFSSRQSLSCCLSRVAKRSTPKPRGPLYSPSEPCGHFPHFRTAWSSSFPLRTEWSSYSLQNCVAPYLLQNLVVLSFFTSEPHGPLPFPSELRGSPIYFGAAWSTLSMAAGPRFKSQRPSSFAAPFPTPPTLPVFFQLYWAAIVSLGRCGPMAWSQSSPRSHAGPVTRGSYFPVPSWVDVTPIPLAQSRATAI